MYEKLSSIDGRHLYGHGARFVSRDDSVSGAIGVLANAFFLSVKVVHLDSTQMTASLHFFSLQLKMACATNQKRHEPKRDP